MVDITAEIKDSSNEILRPGSCAEITVPVSGAREAPVVPQTAVRPSERGFLEFVVVDGVARERVLRLGMRTVGGEVEVRSGLEPGEQVIVRGAEALSDGAAVRVAGAESGAGKAAQPAGAGAAKAAGETGR